MLEKRLKHSVLYVNHVRQRKMWLKLAVVRERRSDQGMVRDRRRGDGTSVLTSRFESVLERRRQMNLARTYQLLIAIGKQRHGFLEITDPEVKNDVREMARAGLVEATLNDGKEGSCTASYSMTAAGQAFLLSCEP
jgi:hypothetical protein